MTVAIDYHVLMSVLRCGVAVAGMVILLRGLARDRRGAARPPGWSLAAIGIVACLAWSNFALTSYVRYIHVHEFFHYYLGSKYQAELGYLRLYKCAAIAQADASPMNDVGARWIRNLVTNEIESAGSALTDRLACTTHFSRERWQAFTADVAWFRSRLDARNWQAVLIDHGYNATPTWTLVGTLLTRAVSSSRRQLTLLALLDPLLIITMFSVIIWAFGWRTACIAALWWGTNLPADFWWTGGAFLRADWLVLTVASLCLSKAGRPFAAGLALGAASLLRIFPALLGLGLILRELALMRRNRVVSVSPEFARFVLGGAVCLVLLVPLSSIVMNGRLVDTDTWVAFLNNSRKHAATPAPNLIGLPTLFAYTPENRLAIVGDASADHPSDAWTQERRDTLAERMPFIWLCVAVYLVLLFVAVRQVEPWVALSLGIGAIPIVSDQSCYYYSVLIGFGLLSSYRQWVGPALAGLSALTCLTVFIPMEDDRCLVLSILIVAFVCLVTLDFARSRPVDQQEAGIAAVA